MITAYKLMRRRQDGTLGSLFFDKRAVIPEGKWLKARALIKKGFAFRPGWHACAAPNAPHLSPKGRVWCIVLLKGVKAYNRPEDQGGLWFTGSEMKIQQVLDYA